jgi:hypothetical protein
MRSGCDGTADRSAVAKAVLSSSPQKAEHH